MSLHHNSASITDAGWTCLLCVDASDAISTRCPTTDIAISGSTSRCCLFESLREGMSPDRVRNTEFLSLQIRNASPDGAYVWAHVIDHNHSTSSFRRGTYFPVCTCDDVESTDSHSGSDGCHDQLRSSTCDERVEHAPSNTTAAADRAATNLAGRRDSIRSPECAAQ